jgi:hypothetical protein
MHDGGLVEQAIVSPIASCVRLSSSSPLSMVTCLGVAYGNVWLDDDDDDNDDVLFSLLQLQ